MLIKNGALLMRHFFYAVCFMTYAALCPTSASAGVSGYLCVPDKATGFSYRNHEWVATSFTVKDTKYILTSKDGKWLWKKMGETNQDKYPQSCIEYQNGYMDCEFMYRKVSFNSQTLRFQIYSNGSYVVHEEMRNKLKNGKNNGIAIEIGTCSSL